uniref:Uncharacterized protein n=1 Tax=Solanum tuberosum TaxID=4113 RepID=M0ZTU5_SOLTU
MILLGHDTCSGVIEPLKRYNISKDDDHPLSLGKTSIWHQYFEASTYYTASSSATFYIT